MRSNSYDVDTNQVLWGTGNPVPMFDPTYRPGDNLYTNSAISWDFRSEDQAHRRAIQSSPPQREPLTAIAISAANQEF